MTLCFTSSQNTRKYSKGKLRLGCFKKQINPCDLKKREKKYPIGKNKVQIHTDGQGSENPVEKPEVCPMFNALQF